jgi:predicted ATP-grasp superfamily ATP-dependent carboligase
VRHQRILVLDARLRQGLVACRALGRAGYDVGAGGYRTNEPAAYSRFVSRYHVLPTPMDREVDFHAELHALVRDERYEVILASDDATLASLARAAWPVPTVPRLDQPFLALTDKVGLADMCREAGVMYPETHFISDAKDTTFVLSQARFPLIVKAARSATLTAGGVRQKKGAVIVHDVNTARGAVEEILAAGLRVVVQDLVPLGLKLIVAIVRGVNGSEMKFVSQSLRDVPPTGGSAAALVSLALTGAAASSAVAALESVCAAAGYFGIAQAECIISRSDGRLFLIDVNPRLWASTVFAERLGLKPVERAIRFALGMPPLLSAGYVAGRRFHHVPSEWRWWVASGRGLSQLAQILATTRPWDTFEPLELSDAQPLVRRILSR